MLSPKSQYYRVGIFPNSTVKNPQMPTSKNRGRTLKISNNSIHINNNGESLTQLKNKTISSSSLGYEESREQRIKENLQRMQKLGIFDLSLKLKPFNSLNKRSYTVRKMIHGSSPSQPRRSSRLQNVTPPTYEVHKVKRERSVHRVRRVKEYRDEDTLLEKGPRREIYTEEHEKLLGDCKTSWTLCVDGYGDDGRRVYDSFTGKTCHQCRQKTLGHRTHCSQCNLFQGQFCGDCLYMRYGENVLEVNQNPDWICPVCRGICNCSLCRKAKGWAPTGYLYRKVASLGFKSVAHYLIETHRHSHESSSTKTPLSARKSLPFLDMETPPSEVIDDKESVDLKIKEKSEMHDIYIDRGEWKHNITAGVPIFGNGTDIKIELKMEENPEMHVIYIDREEWTHTISAGVPNFENGTDIKIEPENVSWKQKSASALEPRTDSIGGRLRKRRQEEKLHEHEEENNAVDGSILLCNVDVKIEPETSSRKQKCTFANELSPDSVGERLRQRRKEERL